jgi:hypothetical protein
VTEQFCQLYRSSPEAIANCRKRPVIEQQLRDHGMILPHRLMERSASIL